MIVGIDLGTTHSLISAWRDGEAVLIPNVFDEYLTPSVVGFDDEGRILVGKAARERLLTHPEQTAAVFKRYMGSQHTLHLNNKAFRPEELSALVLKSLKEDAERFLGEPIQEAIITVPAYFSDAQRKATKAAGELAGLKVERLINEPTAAALAYGLQDAQTESTFLIVDLGGGTFDVSILERFDGVMEVRASAGDNFLGGEDFVDAVVDGFLKGPGKKLPQGSKQTAALKARLWREGERLKKRLSEAESDVFRLEWDGERFEWLVTDEQFLKLVQPLLDRLRKPIEQSLRDARIRAADLDRVVLAGGATRMPIMRKMVARLFGRLPDIHLNPDEVIARGAAVMAGLKARDISLAEMVMTDVCPYTLGTGVSDKISPNQYLHGVYLPVIERNSVVPVSREQTVVTLQDKQTLLKVAIYQGEGRLVKDNVFLGEIDIAVPPKPAGEIAVVIRFTYDVNGILEAEMTVSETGEKHRLVIEKNPGVLTAAEIELRLKTLAELKIHPRAQMVNTAVMARANRLYEELLGDERRKLAEFIGQFERALESQNEHLVRHARDEFSRTLDTFEWHVGV